VEKPASIAEATSAFPDLQEAFRRPGAHPITHGDIRRARVAGPLRQLTGRRVALRLTDDLTTALALTLLDGVAERILLAPAEADDEELRRQIAVAGADAVVTDAAGPADEGSVEAFRVRHPRDLLRTQIDATALPDPTVTEWLIPTSGTTGKPKVVAHPFRSLIRTIRTDRADQDDLVWGLAYGATRFAGVQVLLQSQLSGAPLIVPAPQSDLAGRVRAFADLGCSALSATPTMWRQILMTPDSVGLELQQITLGGEIADEAILRALARRWPGARITHIYASTEAGVGFSVKDGRAGFPAAWLERSPAGVQLAVDKRSVLHIRPMDARQRRLDGPPLFDQEGFIDTGDLVHRQGERYLFLGRENGAINVGGSKVQPEQVEQTLRDCPGVQLAWVRGRPSPITGMVVEAHIVQDASFPTDLARRKEIADFCRQALPAYAVPTVIRFVDDLELNRAGKTLRPIEA
jgi:acyl-CoA synthetase (AMP-forming)/AMP-acid ligase II